MFTQNDNQKYLYSLIQFSVKPFFDINLMLHEDI